MNKILVAMLLQAGLVWGQAAFPPPVQVPVTPSAVSSDTSRDEPGCRSGTNASTRHRRHPQRKRQVGRHSTSGGAIDVASRRSGRSPFPRCRGSNEADLRQ